MSKDFRTFADLPVSLQREALREGERLLDSQFAAATAADQRALTWGGFLLTPATAALGGGIALFNNKPADELLGYISILFGMSLLWAAWTAIQTVRPAKFGFPGNQPAHWLPGEWDCTGTAKEKEQQARIEQAQNLDSCVCDNRNMAAQKARAMSRSFVWTLWTAVIAGVVLLLIMTARHFTILEPISELARLPG